MKIEIKSFGLGVAAVVLLLLVINQSPNEKESDDSAVSVAKGEENYIVPGAQYRVVLGRFLYFEENREPGWIYIQEKVNKLMNEGWRPQGGIISDFAPGQATFYQAMVRKVAPDSSARPNRIIRTRTMRSDPVAPSE